MTEQTHSLEHYPFRVGLLGLGLEAYWAQFDGLKPRLERYLEVVNSNIANSASRSVVNFGLVDNHAKTIAVSHQCREKDIDILLVHITTYALSALLLPIILHARVPVLLLNLQPESSIDYGTFNRMGSRTEMTAEWLAYCSSCPVPEIANVLRRLEIPFHQLTGRLHDDPECWQSVEQWLRAAEVKHTLSHSRLGLMGHYYSGMLDIATDLVQISGRFGTHIEMLEVDRLSALRRTVTPQQIANKIAEFRYFFAIDDDCEEPELQRSARTAVALDLFVAENSLDLMAYYYMGSGISENEDTMSSIILGTSMLTASGVPVAGEYEIKNVLAMKILHELGAGGSFTEFYAMDFNDDLVLMGHDGPGHAGIAQDKIRVRPLKVYHGKVGRGLSVEMAVKHGPVTLLSVVEDRAKGFSLLVAEGESVAGPILEIGNTNSRYRFSLGAHAFVEAWNDRGPAHHCAIGTGLQARQIQKLAELMNLGFHQVC